MKNLEGNKWRNPATGNLVLCLVFVVIVAFLVVFGSDFLYRRSYTPEKDTAFTVTMIVTTPDATVNVYHVTRIPDGQKFTGLAPTNSAFGLNDTVGLVKFKYRGKTCYSVTSVE